MGEANTLNAQGDVERMQYQVERMQAQYDAAKTHYNQALQIFQEIGDKLGEANTLIAQGDVEIMQKFFVTRKGYMKQPNQLLSKILKHLNTKRPSLFTGEKGLKSKQALVFWQLGMDAQRSGNKKLAIVFLKEVLSIYKSIKSPEFQKVQKVIEALDKGIPYDAKK